MADTIREQILFRLQQVLQRMTSAVVLDNCESVEGWEYDWGAFVPELNDVEKKEGRYSIKLGVKSGQQFSLYNKFLSTSYDGTDKELRVWFYVKDKTLLHETAAVNIFLGSDASNYFSTGGIARADLIDVDNDLSNGWNYLGDFIENLNVTGNPDIADLKFIGIIPGKPSSAGTVQKGYLNMDYWHLGDTGWPIDIKHVKRYSASGYGQLNVFPSIVFQAKEEDYDPKIYPAVFSKLRIEIVAWDTFREGDILDQKLGAIAQAIQKALMENQQMGGLAEYVQILRWEFSILEGASRGALYCLIEIGYQCNLKNPTVGE